MLMRGSNGRVGNQSKNARGVSGSWRLALPASRSSATERVRAVRSGRRSEVVLRIGDWIALHIGITDKHSFAAGALEIDLFRGQISLHRQGQRSHETADGRGFRSQSDDV